MLRILSKFNGWQRLFAVLFTFIYLPLVVLVAFDPYIEPVDGQIITKIVNNELKAQHLSTEFNIIENKYYSSPVEKKDYTYSDLIEELGKRGEGEVHEFTGEGYDWKYHIYISRADIYKIKIEDIKLLIQSTIDFEYKKLLYMSYFKTLVYALIIATIFYIFGMSIGWIISGFKKE
jgi:hypothetical protein